MPPVFNFLQQAGKISDLEMQRTFNNGIGIVAVVPPGATADVLQRLNAMGEQAFLIGEILDCKDSSQRIIWE
jgi:phosphoribosylformylglycinamidine cyclo-ligase